MQTDLNKNYYDSERNISKKRPILSSLILHYYIFLSTAKYPARAAVNSHFHYHPYFFQVTFKLQKCLQQLLVMCDVDGGR